MYFAPPPPPPAVAGESHMKMTGVPVGSFRKTPFKVPEPRLMGGGGWLNEFLTLRGTNSKQEIVM